MVFCAANGLRPVMDPSNESLNFTRNRLRKLLIPILETYNPRFREAVWRSAQTLKADHAILRETVETAWQKCVKSQEAELIVFDLTELRSFSGSMQRNLLRLAVANLRPAQETGFALLNRATNFINDPSATRTDLSGGLKLFREGSSLYLTTPGANLPLRQWPQMPEDMASVKLSVPGVVEFPDGWKLSVESWRLPALAREQAATNRDPFQVWLDAERLPDGLELRTRQAGDRFEPLGLEGHSQKLSDFMVNVKMPAARPRWLASGVCRGYGDLGAGLPPRKCIPAHARLAEDTLFFAGIFKRATSGGRLAPLYFLQNEQASPKAGLLLISLHHSTGGASG